MAARPQPARCRSTQWAQSHSQVSRPACLKLLTIWQSLDWLLQSVHLAPRVHSAEFHLKSTREKRSQTLAGCKGALAHTAASGAAPSASEARRCASAGASSGSPSGGAGAPSGAGAAGATDADVVVEGGEGAVPPPAKHLICWIFNQKSDACRVILASC